MTALAYHDLALGWTPRQSGDNKFNFFAITILVILLIVGMVMSNIEIPKEDRTAKRVIPERIAEFVMQREKEKPKPQVKAEAEKPKPKPVIRKEPPKREEKPLTKEQAKAREKAADSGIIALSNDLADLMDTSSVSAAVSGKVQTTSASATQASALNKQVLMADTTTASKVAVDGKQYTTVSSKTTLTSREITKVDDTLAASSAKATAASSTGTKGGTRRADEEVTIVFDQNKSKLYSLYSRARRTNPGLKGKIVIEITIEPAGSVSSVRIISSELNDKNLEDSLISRIKLFKFDFKNTKPVTVTYPIEFLPS